MSLPLPTKLSVMQQGYRSRTLDLRTCEPLWLHVLLVGRLRSVIVVFDFKFLLWQAAKPRTASSILFTFPDSVCICQS